MADKALQRRSIGLELVPVYGPSSELSTALLTRACG